MIKTSKKVCEDGHYVDVETGEVSDELCFEDVEQVQDVSGSHYSITPPVPYVPEKYVENMKEKDLWLKGKEPWLELMVAMQKKIQYLNDLNRQIIENNK